MKLEEIGFYTLSDERAQCIGPESRMQRCELIITDKCNFRCPYCRGLRPDCAGEMVIDDVLDIIEMWAADGLVNIRFSGGEPTLHPHLPQIVSYAKKYSIQRVAISTNGSADMSLYWELIGRGVDDISISLDACCGAFASEMAGQRIDFDKLADTIRELSSRTYVTVGVVITDRNIGKLLEIVEFAHGLGVADIRVISAAQEDRILEGMKAIPQKILNVHPILKYRVNNAMNGEGVRGIDSCDANRCYLVQDDSAVAGKFHFPCIIYMREHGEPIGEVGPNMRAERVKWSLDHKTHDDDICRANCLDVCVYFNNSARFVRHMGSF